MHDDAIILEEKKSTPTNVDFSYQLNIGREKVEKKIFQTLIDISKKLCSEEKKVGALIVLGCFDSKQIIDGMRQLGNKKIEKYLNVAFGQFEADIIKLFETGEDGAIIINQNGQILGTGIYLTVHNPALDIPEGTGTRHISAASFSTRDDVIATFTLSEETQVVRMWKDGYFTEQFNPKDEE